MTRAGRSSLFPSSHMEVKSQLELGIYLPPGESDSVNTQKVGLWLTSFPCGQVFLRRLECSGVFPEGSGCIPSPLQLAGENVFSDIYCLNLA